MSELSIRNLFVSVEGKEILKGVNLDIGQGEVHALMGPNGTGKSTLAYALMGHPNYQVTGGEAWFKGKYHPMLYAWEDVERGARQRLTLAPGESPEEKRAGPDK